MVEVSDPVAMAFNRLMSEPRNRLREPSSREGKLRMLMISKEIEDLLNEASTATGMSKGEALENALKMLRDKP